MVCFHNFSSQLSLLWLVYKYSRRQAVEEESEYCAQHAEGMVSFLDDDGHDKDDADVDDVDDHDDHGDDVDDDHDGFIQIFIINNK